MADICQRSHCTGHAGVFGIRSGNRTNMPLADPLVWNGLSNAQRARSRRLMANLKSAFNAHSRTVTLINAYPEGVNLLSSEVGVNPDAQTSNGFELIRQLTMEYTVRTRVKH